MTIELIDTHAHLYMKQYQNNLDSILSDSAKFGVTRVIVPSSSPESIYQVIELSQKYENIYGALAVHPHESSKFNDDIKKLMEQNLGNKKIVALGESGLDFHYNLSPQKTQIEVFKKHISMAERFNLPIIIHMRESFSEIKNIIDSIPKFPKAVIHCFTGTAEQANYFISKNIFMSFTGAITFNKNKTFEDVVRSIPMDYFFLETDSPYLTPDPYRGEVNHPKHLKIIVEEIAKIKRMEVQDISRITTKNANLFFNLPFDFKPQFYFFRGKTLYLNITNERNTKIDPSFLFRYPYLKAYNLNIKNEPTFEDLKRIIQSHILKVQNVVFLDYGEATLRENVLKDVARFAKEMKLKTILDTDGLANKYHQRNFALELNNIFDCINITLNASNPKEYQKFHRPRYGEESYKEVISFVRECKKVIPSVRINTVSVPGLDIGLCRKNAKINMEVEFEERDYIN